MKDIDKLSLSWFTYEKFYDNHKYDNTTDTTISEDIVKKMARTIFGPDNTYTMVDFYGTSCGSALLTYDSTNKQFNIPVGGCGGTGWYPEYLTEIVEAYEENDEIIIMKKVLYIEYKAQGDNQDLVYADLYNSESKEKTIKTDIAQEEFDNIKTNYLDAGDTYKFIFKKQSDGNYCFYSSELQS